MKSAKYRAEHAELAEYLDGMPRIQRASPTVHMIRWLLTIVAACALASAIAAAQRPTDAERAAALVVHWQQIVYPAFEDARAFIDEENSDHLNAVLSQGAVRVVQDHVDAPGQKKTDQAAGRLAAAIVKAAVRQPGGSLIIDADAFEKGLDAVCPLYPFCER